MSPLHAANMRSVSTSRLEWDSPLFEAATLLNGKIDHNDLTTFHSLLYINNPSSCYLDRVL
jgi:hypothetical protein